MGATFFQEEANTPEVWDMSGAVLSIKGTEGIVLTNASLSYNRPSIVVKGINSPKKLKIYGDGSGQLQIASMLGPGSAIKSFIAKFNDLCTSTPISLNAGGGSTSCGEGTGDSNTFTVKDPSMDSFKMTAQTGQGGIVSMTGTMGFSFTAMSTPS